MLVVLPKSFGDEGHREGWCLYHLGCKGPETYGNCSTLQFCDVGGVWPVAIGHPCYGCNEEGIGFHKGIHQLANVENQTPRSQKPDVNAKEGGQRLCRRYWFARRCGWVGCRCQRDGGA